MPFQSPPSRKPSTTAPQQNSSLELSHSQTEQMTSSPSSPVTSSQNRKSSSGGTTRCWSKDSVYESGNNDTMTSAGGVGSNGNSDDVVSECKSNLAI